MKTGEDSLTKHVEGLRQESQAPLKAVFSPIREEINAIYMFPIHCALC